MTAPSVAEQFATETSVRVILLLVICTTPPLAGEERKEKEEEVITKCELAISMFDLFVTELKFAMIFDIVTLDPSIATRIDPVAAPLFPTFSKKKA